MDITNPQIREYLASVMPERSEDIEEMHQFAIENDVPIIKHEMEQFLAFMVALHKPKSVLEIGTAIGYSGAIMLFRDENETSHLTTLEKSEKMIDLARNNFRKLGLSERVNIIEGDATETIKTLTEPYDMIFMDAAKGQYMNYYDEALRLLKPGGVLIADNILQDGLIAKSRFAIPRRQRTIHGRMRDFIKKLSEHPDLTTSVLPIADGAIISVKKI